MMCFHIFCGVSTTHRYMQCDCLYLNSLLGIEIPNSGKYTQETICLNNLSH